MSRCDRCDRAIGPDDVAYLVWMWVVARVNDELVAGPWDGIAQAMADVAHCRGALPEEIVVADVHCRRSYLVCPACKERLLANPLGRPWPERE
ncbi:hypothetical protein JXA88_10340 [Candidatus Fermentibacteria bacterium]|nr:hypothetical protein [Candidatus Fermentibacteria bacterium]